MRFAFTSDIVPEHLSSYPQAKEDANYRQEIQRLECLLIVVNRSQESAINQQPGPNPLSQISQCLDTRSQGYLHELKGRIKREDSSLVISTFASILEWKRLEALPEHLRLPLS